MATPATVNAWLDELSSTILIQTSTPKQNHKKLQDAFRRRVKRNTYGRTNQFEVDKKLDGLEEKFQILTLDNLSDALHQRRIELRDFGHQWIPDVLDLFIHLSADPARNERLLELYRIPPKIGTPPPLRWKDILADDPIDRRDPLWKVPDFKDHSESAYDDEDEYSTLQSSPTSAGKHIKEHRDVDLIQLKGLVWTISEDDGDTKAAERFNFLKNKSPKTLTESELIREIIFTLSGLPSSLLRTEGRSYRLNLELDVPTIPNAFLGSIMERVIVMRRGIDRINEWLAIELDFTYIGAMKSATEIIMNQFLVHLNETLNRLMNPKINSIVSVIHMIDNTEESSFEVLTVARFLSKIDSSDPVQCLESLYAYTSNSQTSNEGRAYRALSSLLIPGLRAYLQPLWKWIEGGTIDEYQTFFVTPRATNPNLRRIWKEQFSIDHSGVCRPPSFLTDTLDLILICGKTAAFLKYLPLEARHTHTSSLGYLSFELSLDNLRKEYMIPFDTAFRSLFKEHISKCLQEHTVRLKSMLVANCGLTQTLYALGQIYLAQDGALLNAIELKIFDKIDKCVDTWNDRFLITEMLEDAIGTDVPQSAVNAIAIRSVYTSSRTMQDRRKSVKILGAITFEYHLSWPIANIIDAASMTSYQRASLMLMQIRRARHCLQNIGYISASTMPLDEDATPEDQKFAQVLAFKLLVFLNTVYNHFTTTTIGPATTEVRDQMACASTIDAMIEIHQQYIDRIEFSCLTSPKLNAVREIFVAILDMCLRFSDLVSNSKSRASHDADYEHDSFTSARSRYHHAWADTRNAGSDEDDNEMTRGLEEGYSSFIVLDNDTTVVRELYKLQEQFSRQRKLLIAALRGVGRASQHAEDLKGLSDQLVWSLPG